MFLCKITLWAITDAEYILHERQRVCFRRKHLHHLSERTVLLPRVVKRCNR